MSDLKALRERVESATGANEKLDAEILCALLAPPDARVEQSRINFAWCIYHGQDTHGRPRLWERKGLAYRPQGWPVTASLDAAVALVALKLPGHSVTLCTGREGRLPWASITNPNGRLVADAEEATATLSVLSALLAALDGDTPNV